MLGLAPLGSIKALFWGAVVHDVISMSIIVMMMLMAGCSAIMGRFVINIRMRALGCGHYCDGAGGFGD